MSPVGRLPGLPPLTPWRRGRVQTTLGAPDPPRRHETAASWPARRNAPESTAVKSALAARLHIIRVERFGERGGSEMARRLGVPVRTWYNYEIGVTVPAEVLLCFLEVTGVEPGWLLSGEGPRYRERPTTAVVSNAGEPAPPVPPSVVEALLSATLRRLAKGSLRITWEVEETGHSAGG